MAELIVAPVFGKAILRHLDTLAELRIRVFREWPYLYEGSVDYERDYLRHYAESEEAICVLAREGRRIVGASTGLPLRDAGEAFRAPFEGGEFALDAVYYFGESVLLPDYRGRGTGRAFFELRERQARDFGARFAAFCAIDREDDDPRRPDGAQPLDSFWHGLGYRKHPEYQVRLSWREVDAKVDSDHTLTFWIKPL